VGTHTISAAGTPFQAFGRRRRDEAEATAQQGWPYRLEAHTALGGKYATMSRNVQEKLNRGYARGWRLVNVWGGPSPVYMLWDVRASDDVRRQIEEELAAWDAARAELHDGE
jgi:hypothetical protein